MAVAVLFPFALFITGAYLFEYPVTLGILYATNIVLIYVVLWMVINQIIKVQSQAMQIYGASLLLSRKEMFLSFPIIHKLALEIPLASLRSICLLPTRLGYQLKVRFEEAGKTMGVDLDLNPLRTANKDVLQQLLVQTPGLICDETTEQCLQEYERKVRAWKGSYLFSLSLIACALVIFILTSIYLGTGR